MCIVIDDNVKSLNKRIVWKVFDKQEGRIVSLYMRATYPNGKLVERSEGDTRDGACGIHGLYFYTSKEIALAKARSWPDSYIAKFAVDPLDFLFASVSGREAMYERATRIGNFIKVSFAGYSSASATA